MSISSLPNSESGMSIAYRDGLCIPVTRICPSTCRIFPRLEGVGFVPVEPVADNAGMPRVARAVDELHLVLLAHARHDVQRVHTTVEQVIGDHRAMAPPPL